MATFARRQKLVAGGRVVADRHGWLAGGSAPCGWCGSVQTTPGCHEISPMGDPVPGAGCATQNATTGHGSTLVPRLQSCGNGGARGVPGTPRQANEKPCRWHPFSQRRGKAQAHLLLSGQHHVIPHPKLANGPKAGPSPGRPTEIRLRDRGGGSSWWKEGLQGVSMLTSDRRDPRQAGSSWSTSHAPQVSQAHSSLCSLQVQRR